MEMKKLPRLDKALKEKKEKTIFLVRNLLRGLFWLAIIIVGYILLKDRVNFSEYEWLKNFYEKPLLIYFIFSVSEILIGIIPPEFFFIWAARNNDVNYFINSVIILTAITYAAGIIGYWIGRYLNRTRYFRLLKRRFFGKYEKYLFKFGGFLIIVAALTPIPFSGIAMLVGSIRYSFKKYLYHSLARLLRFAAYSYVVWQAHGI